MPRFEKLTAVEVKDIFGEKATGGAAVLTPSSDQPARGGGLHILSPDEIGQLFGKKEAQKHARGLGELPPVNEVFGVAQADTAALFVNEEPNGISPVSTDQSQKEIVVPRVEENVTHQSPVVLRDSRGRIRWKLPGNTEEENQQIGIQNIQGLFLEKFPEFDYLFPRNEAGVIDENKRAVVQEYILTRIGTVKQFIHFFGVSPIKREVAPYFEASHQRVLELSFAPWGIRFIFSKKRNGYWSIERIENDAREFFEQHGDINRSLLIEHGKRDLLRAIHGQPGKLEGLKNRLTTETNKKPWGWWTEENTEQEARRFITQYGSISKQLLGDTGRYDLQGAIARYPGRMTGLLSKLEIKPSQKKHYWTLDVVELEASAFYSEHGVLTYSILEQYRRFDIAVQIRKYPGGMYALREKLGITQENKIPLEKVREEMDRLFDM